MSFRLKLIFNASLDTRAQGTCPRSQTRRLLLLPSLLKGKIKFNSFLIQCFQIIIMLATMTGLEPMFQPTCLLIGRLSCFKSPNLKCVIDCFLLFCYQIVNSSFERTS